MPTNDTIEQLQNEMQNLRVTINAENYESVVFKMKKIDKKISEERIKILLNGVNNTQTRLRELAKIAWECEQPTEDITTNDCSFHKVKIKKYPKLAALKYASAEYENGVLFKLRLNGEKFTMYRTEYKHKESTTYSRPTSFDDFLQLNRIAPQEITMQQFAEITSKIKEANEEIKKQIELYSKKMDDLNAYNLECFKLISKRAEHVYLYTTNQ